MRTPQLHMPHLRASRPPRPESGEAGEPRHQHPAFRTLRRIEGGIDLFAIALVVIFALAMLYALLAPSGTPAYFERWPT